MKSRIHTYKIFNIEYSQNQYTMTLKNDNFRSIITINLPSNPRVGELKVGNTINIQELWYLLEV